MNTYHHGDLPGQLLAHAASMAAESGADGITLRELARRTGVSHSAPVHHFGTRQGLLTALAVEGFEGLNEALSAHPEDIREMGVAYVNWALDHPGHYTVMWQPRLLNDQDEHLNRVRGRAWALLSAAVTRSISQGQETKADSYAAFAIVHGLAGIWLGGALPRPDHPTTVIRQVTQRLSFGDMPPGAPDADPASPRPS